MRNLKKILALVLALVMSLSLMATAGAGSFQDVTDDNPYKTAIDVLDELKVFQGFEDKTFKPDSDLNRAQAAVLVYRIATGDVEGKYVDNYTYMAQSKFDDLEGYNWAKGYINYCQNAKIVVGTSDTKFSPAAPVTGYQLMVMVLRTLGYGAAGEFSDPTKWELETAKIAEREGILKNVTGGDFGAPAKRQMVAEILFRGLLTETVTYSALTPGGYTKSGETLGKRELGLEDIKGVVMANEFADLEDDDTLADGKTRLDVDGKVYNLDVSSELTDIGEIRHAYVQNGTKVLTTLEDLNDSIVDQPENGKGTKVSDLSKVNGETEYFLNFDPLESNTSEWRIEFNVEFVDNDKVTPNVEKEDAKAAFKAAYGDVDRLTPIEASKDNGVYYSFTKSIKAGSEITPADLSIIKGIFDWADGEDINGADADINDGIKGSVYVGANSESSSNRNKNLAVEMTYKQFKADYIDGTYNTITSSDNGEWLKTIDNDGDGVAEYVFRTDFVMSVITGYNAKTENYTVEYDVASNGADRKAEDTIAKADIVTDEELKRDDVILYTKIDGKYYVSYPEVDTKVIDKKGIDYKKQTITCGDTTYDWSGIDYEAYHYYHDVSEAVTEVNYDLYKDHFGYVRLYKEATKGFVLLTDGYYATDRRADDTYKAQIWDDDAKEFTDIDVVDPQINTANYNWFINSSVDITGGDHDDEGTWGRLNGFNKVYRYANNVAAGCTPVAAKGNYVTNIAMYDQSGDMYTLDYVSNATNRYAYRTHELDMDKTTGFPSLKSETLYCADTTADEGVYAHAKQRINTTNDTVYYYVTWEVDDHGIARAVDVVSWTGYKNTPDGIALDNDYDQAYAVTSAWEDPRTTTGSDTLPYEIAEIVVIESEIHGAPAVVFPVSLYQRLLGRNRVGGMALDGAGYNEFEAYITDQKDTNNPMLKSITDEAGSYEYSPVDISDLLKFYQIDRYDRMWEITKDFGEYGIHAGYITTSYQTDYREYVQVNAALSADDKAAVDYTFNLDTPIYKLGYDKNAAARTDNLLWNGFQTPQGALHGMTGDVSSTFSATELYYATDWDLGDRVIYMNKGNTGYFVINVSKSAAALNSEDADVAASKIGYRLDDLWDTIVADQAANSGTSLEKATALYEKAMASKDAEDVTAALDALNALKGLTAAEAKDVADMIADLEVLADGVTAAGVAAELKAAWEAYDASTKTSSDKDKLAKALLKYYEYEDSMSVADKTSCSSELANTEGAVAGWKISTTETTFADIKEEYAKANDLTAVQIEAIEAVDPTADVAADKATVKQQYEDACKYKELAQDIISGYAAYSEAWDTTKLGDLLDDYNEMKSHGSDVQRWFTGEAWLSNFTNAYNSVDVNYSSGANWRGKYLTAAQTALAGTTWTAITGSDLTISDVAPKLKAEAEKLLKDAGYGSATVSIDFGSGGSLPAVGTKNGTAYFNLYVVYDSTNSTGLGGQTVTVTNNYSLPTLTAAVKSEVENSGVANGSWSETAAETAAVSAIEGVSSDITNIKVVIEAPVKVEAGATYGVTVTATSTLGSISFTTTATLTA